MPALLSFNFGRTLVWLLACLLPLQGLAAGAIAVAGPTHTHLPALSTRIVLDDFRRAPVRHFGGERHVASTLGHFHDSDPAERHHHAADDPTVVIDATDLLQTGDADDSGFSPSLAVFVGLVSELPTWSSAAAPAPPNAHPRWSPQTHHPAFPERPPRGA
ncbi:MAG: hypothetical protein ABIQ06_12460 [Caldimonas sp.]